MNKANTHSLGLIMRPDIRDGCIDMSYNVYDDGNPLKEYDIHIGTKTDYKFEVTDKNTNQILNPNDFKTWLNEKEISHEYDTDIIDPIFDVMQIIKSAVDGKHYDEIRDYLNNPATETSPEDIDPEIDSNVLAMMQKDVETIKKLNRYLDKAILSKDSRLKNLNNTINYLAAHNLIDMTFIQKDAIELLSEK